MPKSWHATGRALRESMAAGDRAAQPKPFRFVSRPSSASPPVPRFGIVEQKLDEGESGRRPPDPGPSRRGIEPRPLGFPPPQIARRGTSPTSGFSSQRIDPRQRREPAKTHVRGCQRRPMLNGKCRQYRVVCLSALNLRPKHLFEQIPSMIASRIHHHDVRMIAQLSQNSQGLCRQQRPFIDCSVGYNSHEGPRR